MNNVFRLVFLSMVMAVGGARAEYVITEKGTAPASKKALKETKKIAFPSKDHPTPNPERDAIKKLSVLYNIPTDRLQYFRDLHHGYADIVPALIVAREAQVEPGRVIKMRDEGQLWPNIAKAFSVDQKILDQESSLVLKDLKKTLPPSAINDLPRKIQ